MGWGGEGRVGKERGKRARRRGKKISDQGVGEGGDVIGAKGEGGMNGLVRNFTHLFVTGWLGRFFWCSFSFPRLGHRLGCGPVLPWVACTVVLDWQARFTGSVLAAPLFLSRGSGSEPCASWFGLIYLRDGRWESQRRGAEPGPVVRLGSLECALRGVAVVASSA